MSEFDVKLKSELHRLWRILVQQEEHWIYTDRELYFRFMETYYHVNQKRKRIRKRDLQNIKDMDLELIESEKEESTNAKAEIRPKLSEDQDGYA